MRNIIIVISLIISISCASSVMKNLTVEEKDFLSKVRYIISKEEKKNFLSLPPSERSAFIEEFWKRRDIVPETEANEFKEEYFKRISEANKLFGKNGWLQDRGMVYVLLGQPTERYTYPMGRYHGDLPTEIWFYGFFPIVFVDLNWSGNYQLTPLSARQIAEINKAQVTTAPQVKTLFIRIDFDFDVQKNLVQITIPYKSIALKKKDSIFYTTLSLNFRVKDRKGKEVLNRGHNFDLSFSIDDIKNLKSPFHTISLDINLEKGIYEMELFLKNLSNNSSKKKIKKISLL